MPEAVGRQTRTVLVVDDESSVRSVLRRILGRGGYAVLDAGDGRAALDLFKTHFETIDVVLLDLAMPEMSGDEVLRQLRRLSRGVRVILCTGKTRDEAEETIGDLDGLGFVRKPFRPNDLYEAIDRVLAD